MFDLIVLAVLLVSAAIGFIRGATTELFSVVAFIAAVIAAILILPLSTPLAHRFIATGWMAKSAALLVVFLIVYVILRVAGSIIARKIHSTRLGVLDRAVGVGFGLVRALVILGVFNIVFHAATPPERTPKWVLDAKLYPLTAFSAKALQALAPKGSAVAGRVAPALERSLRGSDDTPPKSKGDKPTERGYDPAAQKRLDDLVEKSL
jgi:membrane protein required for colicin V production